MLVVIVSEDKRVWIRRDYNQLDKINQKKNRVVVEQDRHSRIPLGLDQCN